MRNAHGRVYGKMVKLILDTDIGPDCDDAFALAMLNSFQNKGLCEILCVTHCTSNEYGAGCADAINKFYGNKIPVGTLEKEGFLCDDNCKKYNKFITENFNNDFKTKKAQSAVELLRKTLSEAKEKSVVFVSIGPLVNLSNLLNSPPDKISKLNGKELVKEKVRFLSCMAGTLNGKEYNIICDINAAMNVCENFNTEIIFSTFEVGEKIITGRDLSFLSPNNPVRAAYDLYAPSGRNSWDLTSAWHAVKGCEPFFEFSERGHLSTNPDGTNTWTKNKNGSHRYLVIKADINEIENGFERVLDE